MDSNLKCINKQIEQHKDALLNTNEEICLTSVFESDGFQEIISECREFRGRVYTPLVTLLMFIRQVLNPDKSCKRAVAAFIAEKLGKGEEDLPSSNTGPYCKARNRLPEKSVHELVKMSGTSMIARVPAQWKVYGRDIKSVDGTTLKMADTMSNQKEYPQHGNQKTGAGFPILRLVAVMSLTLGTIIDYAIGAYKGKGTGEQSLFSEISDSINKNDIVLADKYFPSFFLWPK